MMSALVSTSISQRKPLDEFQTSVRSLRVKRYGTGNQNQQAPDRSGKTIQGFSAKSRSRLRLYATNNSHRIKSQFGLTYHEKFPNDGRIAKKHLNAWLQYIRRNFDIGYLWILEFQSRGAAHFHVFLSIEPDQAIHQRLAEVWNRITGESEKHLRVHQHSTNWIKWDIGTGQYLAKYLDKESQKHVPENCHNFGRFWGNSSCMKPEFIGFPVDDLDQLSTVDQDTGEIYGGKETVLRWLGRLAEKQTRGYSRFRTRVAYSSYTLLDGVKCYDQIERYFSNLIQKGTTINGKINSRASNKSSLYQDDQSPPGQHDRRSIDVLLRQPLSLG